MIKDLPRIVGWDAGVELYEVVLSTHKWPITLDAVPTTDEYFSRTRNYSIPDWVEECEGIVDSTSHWNHEYWQGDLCWIPCDVTF